jgi:hypothetical protein
MITHSPEPWICLVDGAAGQRLVLQSESGDADYGAIASCLTQTPDNDTPMTPTTARFPRWFADMNRAAACVNACAGMAEPATEIAALKERVANQYDELNGIRDYLWPNQAGLPNEHRNALLAIKAREKLLTDRRDELLAALKDVTACLESFIPKSDSEYRFCKAARAAIAHAEWRPA